MFDPNAYAAVMSHAPNFFTEVRNPKWADQAKTKINCEVNFKHIQDEEWTPFTADPQDYMPYSKEIFDRAVAGEFGEVAEPDAPIIDETPYTPEQLEAFYRYNQRMLSGQMQITGSIPGVVL